MTKREIEKFQRMYLRFQVELYNYSLSIARNRELAEDAVQTAVARILACDTLPREPRPYMFRCVKNAVTDVLRRKKFTDDRDVRDCDNVTQAPDPDTLIDLKTCLARLAEDEQDILHLKYAAGFKLREIAGIRAESESRTKSRYTRSLIKLREMYNELEIEETAEKDVQTDSQRGSPGTPEQKR